MLARPASLVLCACLLSGWWSGDVLPARFDENRPGNATNEVAKRSAATTTAAAATEPTTVRRPAVSAKAAAAAAAATTTRWPPATGRPRAGGTTARPVKPKGGRNVTAAAATVWPKPDKRLGGGKPAGRTPPPPPNRTAVGGGGGGPAARSTPADADFKAKYPTDVWKGHGFYTDDYVRLINGHWFKFMPPGPTAHYVLAVLYTVIMAFGCSGNLLVIFMYIKCKSLQTPANVLIMNLAVSDFFMLAKTPVFIYNSIYQGPTLGKLGCQVYGFFGGLTGTVSIMTLAAISVDRYYVIVHPLNAAVNTTKQRARVWIAAIWMYGLVFSAVPALDLGYNRYVPEGYLTSCSFDYLTDVPREKAFVLTFFAAAWCVPFAAISYCYVKILTAVWVTSEMTASRYGQEHEKRKTEIRLGYVVVGVIALWFVSWTPYAVVALLGVFDQKEYITPLGSMVPALFCKAASCMDPWIYAITHPRFKNELAKLLTRKKTRKLERDYGVKKGWTSDGGGVGGGCVSGCDGGRSRSATGVVGLGGNFSSTEDEDVEEVMVMVGLGADKTAHHRQGSTSSHKTEETKALETRFPPTRQESLKYMPPSWYKMPRASSKSSIKMDVPNAPAQAAVE